MEKTVRKLIYTWLAWQAAGKEFVTADLLQAVAKKDTTYTRNTTGKIMAPLVELGAIERLSDPDDRRVRIWRILDPTKVPEYEERRGGPRPNTGNVVNPTKSERGEPITVKFGTRLYPADIEKIHKLKDRGYAPTLAAVIRRAIDEAI
jgi:hypothetical protein